MTNYQKLFYMTDIEAADFLYKNKFIFEYEKSKILSWLRQDENSEFEPLFSLVPSLYDQIVIEIKDCKQESKMDDFDSFIVFRCLIHKGEDLYGFEIIVEDKNGDKVLYDYTSKTHYKYDDIVYHINQLCDWLDSKKYVDTSFITEKSC